MTLRVYNLRSELMPEEFSFDINSFQKVNAKKSATNVKYLRFKKDKHPEAFKLIAEYNRSLDLERLVNEFVKRVVMPSLPKKK